MVDRKDIGSWLTGPDTSGISKYPGERLGLPEAGPGSIARAGRRILAICIDWGIALLISNFAFGGESWATLAVFRRRADPAGRHPRLQHRPPDRGDPRASGWAAARPGPLAALVRTLLLCLVIPAVIFDPDQRGLHDKAMNTVLVRM